jgi:hypothetical protein
MTTVDEIDRKQREERQTIRRDAELLGELMGHRGWPRYMALVESVAQNYHATIMKPMEHVLEVTKMEFAKGALSGLSLATSLPQLKIREAEELRRTSPGAEEATEE